MKRFQTVLCSAMALCFAVGTAIPASAATLVAQPAWSGQGDVVQVQNRFERRQERRFERRQERRQDRFDRRQDRREARFERRNGVPYYGQYRGYRDRRPGYRYHNGFWFPSAAFITGVIVGSGAASARPSSNAHVQWCSDRYRSYRVSDDTYQPTSGPRRLCNSPYR